MLAGKYVVGHLVRKACERHLDDLKNGPKRGLVWNVEKARYAINFFPYLKHSKGKFANKSLVLEPWQAFCIGSMFGWVIAATGLRRFKTCVKVVGKKNGKSTELAGVGILALDGDGEEGAEVYSTATKKDQARLIFDEARRMVAKSPDLADRIRSFKLNLSVDETGSKFEPLSSDDKSGDGINPSCVLIDELHRHKSRAMLDLMDQSVGARSQPLLFIITTGGDDDPTSPYNTEIEYAMKVVEGVVKDDSYFAYIAMLDKGDRWDDPAVWPKANPNMNVSVDLEDMKRLARKAKNNPAAQASFKRLRLNIRVSDATKPIDIDVWRKNSVARFDPASLNGRACFGGLDLSSKIDLSSSVRLFPPEDGEKRFKVVSRFWMPKDTIDEKSDRDQVQYRLWIQDGWIEPTLGNVIDQNEIKAAVIADHRDTPYEGLNYDPWNATKLVLELQDEGLPMFEFIQGLRSYTAPTKELLAMLLQTSFDFGGNPVMEWMASNLKTQTDKNENLMPHKQKSTGRIDGITALIMALGRYLSTLDGGSPYEKRGLLIM